MSKLDFNTAKSEFEAVVEGFYEDSPSRQMARQKLQHVRSLGTTGSPLYRAALEEMAGGLGTNNAKRTRNNPILVKGRKVREREEERENITKRKVPRMGLKSKSLYHVLKLWSTDNGTPLINEPVIDVYNLPSLPKESVRDKDKDKDKDSGKRKRVEDVLNEEQQEESRETLLEDMVKRAKESKARDVKVLAERETLYHPRLLALEDMTKVPLVTRPKDE